MAVVLIGVTVLLSVWLGYRLGSGEHEVISDDPSGVRRLHVESGRLEDEDGKVVQLTGMSSHGLLFQRHMISV